MLLSRETGRLEGVAAADRLLLLLDEKQLLCMESGYLLTYTDPEPVASTDAKSSFGGDNRPKAN